MPQAGKRLCLQSRTQITPSSCSTSFSFSFVFSFVFLFAREHALLTNTNIPILIAHCRLYRQLDHASNFLFTIFE